MSFNTQHCLNYLEQKIDFDIMADAVKKCDTDIIGLNEMRGECNKAADYADQTANLSRITGIQNYYFAETIKFGGIKPYSNAMLTKLTITARISQQLNYSLHLIYFVLR